MDNTSFFYNVSKSGEMPILKLYNDKITFGVYHKIGMPRYKWVHPRYKQDLKTGEFVRHTHVDAQRAAQNFKASLNRSLRKIWEIDEKNTFGYFFTITFVKEYVDRQSARECYRAFRNIIKRLKYTYGKMEYLAVGEFHENKAIHFHMMCNFLESKPKLRYRRKESGESYYIILDDFKKEDCFIAVEKLKTNNTAYLVKYFTKSDEFPLARRFSCSRSLKRSRAVKSVKLYDDEFNSFYNSVLDAGFLIKYKDRERCSLVLEEHTPRDAVAGVDLFNKDTKDENRVDIHAVWDLLMLKLRNSRGCWTKIYKI